MAPAWHDMARSAPAGGRQQLGAQLAADGRAPIGRQLAAARARRAAVQQTAPGEGRRPAGHEPVVSQKFFYFLHNAQRILYICAYGSLRPFGLPEKIAPT
jgi:hypothetical protein